MFLKINRFLSFSCLSTYFAVFYLALFPNKDIYIYNEQTKETDKKFPPSVYQLLRELNTTFKHWYEI